MIADTDTALCNLELALPGVEIGQALFQYADNFVHSVARLYVTQVDHIVSNITDFALRYLNVADNCAILVDEQYRHAQPRS